MRIGGSRGSEDKVFLHVLVSKAYIGASVAGDDRDMAMKVVGDSIVLLR